MCAASFNEDLKRRCRCLVGLVAAKEISVSDWDLYELVGSFGLGLGAAGIWRISIAE